MSGENAVSLFLAGPTMEVVLQQMYPPFSQDAGRFRVVSLAGDWENTVRQLTAIGVEALIVQADVAPTPQELAKLLKTFRGVAFVVLPPALAGTRQLFESVDRVKQVLLTPVNYFELAQAVYQAVMTERALAQQVSPTAASFNSRSGGSVMPQGLRVFAFFSTKGGAGKTVLAASMAQEMSRRGVGTVLIGCTSPDPLAVVLGLKAFPNSGRFFKDPTPDGLRASMQKKDALDVILAPADVIEASTVAQVNGDERGSIRGLVSSAAFANYGAVVLDLPSDTGAWAIQPLLVANTVLLVAEPTIMSAYAAVAAFRLLTETLAGQHRIPTENIFLVLNKQMSSDNLSPADFHKGAQEFLGRAFPPVIGTIPFDPRVRLAVNESKSPLLYVDAFGQAVRSLVDNFYMSGAGGRVSVPGAAPRKTFSLGGLRIKVR